MANYKEGSEEAEKRKKKIKAVYGSQAAYNAAHKKEIEAGTVKAMNTVVHARGVDTQNPESVKRAESEHEASIDSWRVSQGMEPHSDKFWSKDSVKRRGKDYSGYDSALIVKYDLDRKQQEAANLAPLMKASAQSVSGAGAEQSQRSTTPKAATPAYTTTPAKQPAKTYATDTMIKNRDQAEAQGLAALAAKQATTPKQAALNAQNTTAPTQAQKAQRGAEILQQMMSRGKTSTTAPTQAQKAEVGRQLLTRNLSPSTQINGSLTPQQKQQIAEEQLTSEGGNQFLKAVANRFRSAPGSLIQGLAQMGSEGLKENMKYEYSDAGRNLAEKMSDALAEVAGKDTARKIREQSAQQLQQAMQGKGEVEKALMQVVYSVADNLSYLVFTPYAIAPAMGANAAADSYYTLRQQGVEVNEALARSVTEGVISTIVESMGGFGAAGLAEKLTNKAVIAGLSKAFGRDMTAAVMSAATKALPSLIKMAGSEGLEESVEFPLQVLAAYICNQAFGNDVGYVPESLGQGVKEAGYNTIIGALSGLGFGLGNVGTNALNTAVNPQTPMYFNIVSDSEGNNHVFAFNNAEEATKVADFLKTSGFNVVTTAPTEPNAPQTSDVSPESVAPQINETAQINGQAAGLPYNAFSAADKSSYTQNEETLSTGVQAATGTDVLNPAARRIDEAFANGMPEGEPSFGSATVGAAERNPKSYSALANEYGTLPEGENPARTVDVPAQTSPTDKVGRFTRTLMEAQITPEEYMGEYEKLVEKGVFSYQSESDQEAFNKAVQHAAEVPFGNVAAEFDGLFRNNKALDKDSLFLGQLVYATAIKNGDTELAMKTAAQLVVAGTETGRAEQAFRFMKKISSETVNKFGQRVNVYYWELMANRLSKRFNADIKLDKGLMKNLSEAKTEEDVQKANDALKANLAKQIPSDTMAKWTAWRYMSMLGNLKTFERNFLGNSVMVPVRGLKEVIKAGIQRTEWAKKMGATITTTTATPTQVQKDYAKADFDYMREEIMGANKYNDELNSIVQDRTIFQFAPLEATRRGINWAMNNGFFGDEAFAKIAFVDAEAKYFRANNIDPNSASAKEINNAREYAINEARNATYRQANKLAQAIIRAGRSSKLAGFFKDAYIPFVTTPLNVLETGVNYSPIGLIRALTYDCYQVKNGKMTADAMIDHLSSGIVGSGVSMLGYFMAAMGMVTGGEGDNDKENSWFDLNGGQHYAIKIGDGSYTIDWLTPVCIPLFMGVELYRALHDEYTLENAADLVDAVIATVNRTAEPMFGLSMLQGISNALLRQSYKTEGRAVGFLGDAAASLISQNIPTVLGQLARTVAPNAQNAHFIDKTDNMPDAAQRILNQILVKTPVSQWAINQLGGDYQIPERINAWGEKDTAPLGERFVENFFSPGYWEKSDNNIVNKGIEALYGKTGDTAVLPSVLGKSYKVDGKDVYFSTEEYEKAQEIAGKTSKQMLESLFNSSAYRGLTDDQKADWIADIYDYTKKLAKKQTVGVDYDTTRIEKYQDTGLSFNAQVQLYRILESESESAEQDAQIAEAFGVDAYTARDYRRKANGKYYYALTDIGNDDEKTAAKAAMLGEYGFTEEDVLACYNAHAGSGQKKADYIADATYALINQGYDEAKAEDMAFYFYAVANQLKGFKVE